MMAGDDKHTVEIVAGLVRDTEFEGGKIPPAQ
jgi:hypothetical protein